MDTERPTYGGLDDSFRPSLGGGDQHSRPQANLDEELNIQTPKNTVTYDELRQRNREKHAQSQINSHYQ